MKKIDGVKKSCLRPLMHTIVTCKGKDGRTNAIPVYYCSNCSYQPPMVTISINPERFSYHLIKDSGVFVINLPSTDNTEMFNFFQSTSGKKVDKLAKYSTTKADLIDCPILNDCPVNIECKIVNSVKTGSHETFIAEVLKVHEISKDYDSVDESAKVLLTGMLFV